jgi:hypothetical protein
VYLEAAKGALFGDFSGVNKAWDVLEKYMIPSPDDQPTNSAYKTSHTADFAPESDFIKDYPTVFDRKVTSGNDLIGDELKNTYSTAHIYGMHWYKSILILFHTFKYFN